MDIQNLLFFDLEIFESKDQEPITIHPDICGVSLDWDTYNIQPAI